MSIHVSNDMSIHVADDMSIDVVYDMSIDVSHLFRRCFFQVFGFPKTIVPSHMGRGLDS